MYEAQKRYDKKNTKSFSLKLNYNTDADMIAFLEAQNNVQGFLKSLINVRMNWDTQLMKRYHGGFVYTDTDSIKEEETNENQNN